MCVDTNFVVNFYLIIKFLGQRLMLIAHRTRLAGLERALAQGAH